MLNEGTMLNGRYEILGKIGACLLYTSFCHEIDHLDGHLYVEKVEGELEDMYYEED